MKNENSVRGQAWKRLTQEWAATRAYYRRKSVLAEAWEGLRTTAVASSPNSGKAAMAADLLKEGQALRHHAPAWVRRWPRVVCAIIVATTLLIVIGLPVSHVLSPKGLVVAYYRGTNFDHAAARRHVSRVAIDYGDKRPALGVPGHEFSARWMGYLAIPESAEYAFFLQSDDGSRLFIDDALVIDHWSDHGWNPGRHGSMRLDKGLHRIRIEHYNRSGQAALRLKWAGGPIPDNTILSVPYLFKRNNGKKK